MGIICTRIDKEKQRLIFLKTQEAQKRQLEDLRIYYKSNKEFMNPKIKEVFKAVSREGTYQFDTLNLNFVNLQESRSEYLLQVMPYLENIRVLRLWKTFLGPDGIRTLSIGLGNLLLLEVLSLEDNLIGQNGCTYLAEALKNLRNLKELWLHINEIRPGGAYCLAEVVGKLSSLEKLVLDENDMEDEGSLKLALSLKDLKNLKVIGIGYNLISEDAMITIAEVLSCLNLEKIIVTGNYLSETANTTILKILRKTIVNF